MGNTAYFFIPVVRRGLARAIAASPTGAARRVAVPVPLTLRADVVDGGVETPADFKVPRVELYGPGDILGFDERIMVRRDPLPDVGDFEPNFFPSVEFAEADFPWRFTPAPASASGLTPWIALLVLCKEEGEFLDGGRKSSDLPPFIQADLASLPDLTHAWRWAHVMVTGEDAPTTTAQEQAARGDADPDSMLSRLLCPRRLKPQTRYHAFIVPAFETGRLAGLGLKPEAASSALAPSWEVPQTAAGPSDSKTLIELPYYARWEFGTSARGDFEYLVRLLEPRKLTGLGRRPMACPPHGYFTASIDRGVDSKLPHTLDLEGALSSLDFEPTRWGKDPQPVPPSVAWPAGSEAARVKLASLINTPQVEALNQTDSGLVNVPHARRVDDTTDPVVGPPMYGRWHAAQRYVQTAVNSWCDVLNLDPRHRAAAGLGSLVVQRLQEELMASAWNQLGEVEKLNDVLRAAQLAREASVALHRRLTKLPNEKLLRLAAPAGGRVRLSAAATAKTVLASIMSSKLPAAALDPALRRIARPRGPLRARQFRSSLTARASFAAKGDLLPRLSAGSLTAAKEKAKPATLFAMDDITKAAFGPSRIFQRMAAPSTLAATSSIRTLIDPIRPVGPIAPNLPGMDPRLRGVPLPGAALPGAPIAEPRPIAPVGPAPVTTISSIRFSDEDVSLPNLTGAVLQLRNGLPSALQPWGAQLDPSIEAAREALDWLNQPGPEPAVLNPLGSLATAAVALRAALDPKTSIVNRLKKRIRGLPPMRADHLAPLMAAPEFPDPMYVPLAEISQDLVLPGIETVPQNTLALLKVNPRFIESYMAGCNHEFAGELLWREYPTDQRGSYFRQFFEPADPDTATKDITPLHTWRKNALGTNQVTKVDLVLLVRGDLLKKYPNTLVYAVRGVKENNMRKPNLEGFVTKLQTGEGMDPVWPMITGSLSPDVTFFGFVLTQAQVKSSATSEGYYFILEQRVSEPRFGIDEQTTVDGAIGNWNDLAWVHFSAVAPGAYLNAAAPTPSAAIAGAEVWGASSAALASILMQDPVRVAVHADQMLPSEDQPTTT